MKRPFDGTIETDNINRPRLDSAHDSYRASPSALENTICTSCNRIDFDNILKDRLKIKRRFRVADISHINSDAQCPLCVFFKDVRPEGWKIGDRLSLVCAFGESVFGLPAQVTDCLLLGVAKEGVNGPDAPETYFMDLSRNRSPFKSSVIKPLVDYDYLQSIDRFCHDRHGDGCQRKVPLGLHAFRVIDCGKSKLVTIDHANAPYLTLSYLWGSDGLQGDGEREDLPPDIPATIRDAIALTLRLGYQYLWVDRYCIRQRHGSEKAELIKSMGQIYSASSLTIIAACGTGSSYGLPGISRRRAPQASVSARGFSFVSISDPTRAVLKSRWNSRGWTYQEGLLARRQLVFTDSQVYFQCAGMCCVESFAVPLELVHKNPTMSASSALTICRVFPLSGFGYKAVKPPQYNENAFFSRVNEFNGRDFTYEVDAPAAFQGILAAFLRQNFGVLHGLAFYADSYSIRLGMPIRGRTVTEALLWTGCARSRRRVGLPSWTWIGWKGLGPETSGLLNRYTASRSARTFRSCDQSLGRSKVAAQVEIADLAPSGSRLAVDTGDDYATLLSFLRNRPPPTELFVAGWTFALSVSWIRHHPLRSPINSALGPPSRFDIRGNEAMIDVEEDFIAVIMLRDPTKWMLCCLVLEHGIDGRYERAGTAQFMVNESKTGTLFNEDFSDTLHEAITWKQITLV